VNLGSPVNTSFRDSIPNISADGLSLFFASNRPGGFGDQYDLWITTRETINDPWSEPVNLGSTVNSSYYEEEPCISADGLALFFSSERPPGEYLSGDIWVATRPTTNDEWGEPVNLGQNVNTSYVDTAPDISADGSILYFHSDRAGGSGGRDLWQVSIEPVVDLNGDGIVDSADMCIMVDHWGTDDSLCDIGPMPWGDGIVDVQDLIVLAEHLFEEFPSVEVEASE
jgi:Tol biopolymer transport system component